MTINLKYWIPAWKKLTIFGKLHKTSNAKHLRKHQLSMSWTHWPAEDVNHPYVPITLDYITVQINSCNDQSVYCDHACSNNNQTDNTQTTLGSKQRVILYKIDAPSWTLPIKTYIRAKALKYSSIFFSTNEIHVKKKVCATTDNYQSSLPVLLLLGYSSHNATYLPFKVIQVLSMAETPMDARTLLNLET